MNEIPPVSDPSSLTNGESRDWFYRLGGRERGPLTLAQLTDLAASSGEVANEIEVRKGQVGEWVPYEAIDSATAKRLHSGRSTQVSNVPPAGLVAQPASSPVFTASTRSGGDFKLLEKVRDNWTVLAGVFGLVAFNVILWNLFDPLQSTERRYFQVLSDAAQKAQDARTKGLDPAERSRLAKSVVEEVKPMVEDLKKTASSSAPIRQHLLWAAKDQLPRLFSANGKELNECEGIFRRHMYEAGRRLGFNIPRPATSVVIR